MADFVSSDDDAGESTGVFNDSDAVDLFKALVNNTSSADVGESWTNG